LNLVFLGTSDFAAHVLRALREAERAAQPA
jgi:methionyl-tRNA formyltransferase